MASSRSWPLLTRACARYGDATAPRAFNACRALRLLLSRMVPRPFAPLTSRPSTRVVDAARVRPGPRADDVARAAADGFVRVAQRLDQARQRRLEIGAPRERRDRQVARLVARIVQRGDQCVERGAAEGRRVRAGRFAGGGDGTGLWEQGRMRRSFGTRRRDQLADARPDHER